MKPAVALADVREAAARIAGLVVRTPLVRSELLSERCGRSVLVKLENRQRARCFKPRGALNAALAAASEGRVEGLVTFSSGNHGQAVATAARELGVPSLVVSPEDVRPEKLAAMRELGAEVVLHGMTSGERMARARQVAAETGWLLVPPYDHPHVVAGQGTVGLEIAEDAPELAAVVVPVGGGGLVSGVATALAALRPGVRVVGVEPEDADDARRSLAEGRLVRNERPSRSSCDGLRNTQLGDLNWELFRALVHEVVTVTDDQVDEAASLLEDEGFGPVEPSGAASSAAILAGAGGAGQGAVVAVVSGGNAASPRSPAEPSAVP